MFPSIPSSVNQTLQEFLQVGTNPNPPIHQAIPTTLCHLNLQEWRAGVPHFNASESTKKITIRMTVQEEDEVNEYSFSTDAGHPLPQVLGEVVEFAESHEFHSLECINVWSAIISPTTSQVMMGAMEKILTAGHTTLEQITFMETSDRSESVFSTSFKSPLTSIQLEAQSNLFLLFGNVQRLTALTIPDFHLSDSDVSYMSMIITGLTRLTLGRDAPKTKESLTAIRSLLSLESLQWDGWTNSHLRELLQSPAPPRLAELILEDEPDLQFGVARHLAACPTLSSLKLVNVPHLFPEKYSQQAILYLETSNIVQLHLYLSKGCSLVGLSKYLLNWRLKHLTLGGDLAAEFLSLLLQQPYACVPASTGSDMFWSSARSLRSLTLDGVDLGQVDWQAVMYEDMYSTDFIRRHPQHGLMDPNERLEFARNAEALAAQISRLSFFGFHQAVPKSDVPNIPPLHLSRVQREFCHPILMISSLRLMNCANLSSALPFIAYFPTLQDLFLLLYQEDDHDGDKRSPVETIRTLDFLTLTSALSLRSIECEYEIRAHPPAAPSSSNSSVISAYFPPEPEEEKDEPGIPERQLHGAAALEEFGRLRHELMPRAQNIKFNGTFIRGPPATASAAIKGLNTKAA